MTPAVERSQQRLLSAHVPPRPLAASVAIWCSGAAAVAHVAVVPEHFREWPAAGAFFVVLAAAQGWLAFALVRTRIAVPVLISAVVGTVGVVSMYVVSRTAGLPFGSHHGGEIHHPGAAVVAEVVEGVGAVDLAALIAELVLVVALVAMLPRQLIGRTTNALLAVGLTFWILSTAGLLG
jgi:hypothetical protein